jgi:hypothetical protein
MNIKKEQKTIIGFLKNLRDLLSSIFFIHAGRQIIGQVGQPAQSHQQNPSYPLVPIVVRLGTPAGLPVLFSLNTNPIGYLRKTAMGQDQMLSSTETRNLLKEQPHMGQFRTRVYQTKVILRFFGFLNNTFSEPFFPTPSPVYLTRLLITYHSSFHV